MWRWLLRIAAALAVVAAGAATGWYLFGRSLPRPLDANWVAMVGVLAGDGVAGFRDGVGSNARFSDPFGITTTATGDLIVAVGGDAQRIRRITVDGRVSAVAGGPHGQADGPAAGSRFETPSGVAATEDGTVY